MKPKLCRCFYCKRGWRCNRKRVKAAKSRNRQRAKVDLRKGADETNNQVNLGYY